MRQLALSRCVASVVGSVATAAFVLAAFAIGVSGARAGHVAHAVIVFVRAARTRRAVPGTTCRFTCRRRAFNRLRRCAGRACGRWPSVLGIHGPRRAKCQRGYRQQPSTSAHVRSPFNHCLYLASPGTPRRTCDSTLRNRRASGRTPCTRYAGESCRTTPFAARLSGPPSRPRVAR